MSLFSSQLTLKKELKTRELPKGKFVCAWNFAYGVLHDLN